MSTPILVPLVDVDNRVGVRWIAELTEAQAAGLGSLSVSVLSRAAKAQPRSAVREAAIRHYAVANYR